MSTCTFQHSVRQGHNFLNSNSEKGERPDLLGETLQYMNLQVYECTARDKHRTLHKPRTTAAEATWQRESSHSATVRSCLARGNWQQGTKNAVFTTFLWVYFILPRPGWSVVFTHIYYMWVYMYPWPHGIVSNRMFNAGSLSRLTNIWFVNIKSLKQSLIIFSFPFLSKRQGRTHFVDNLTE